MTTRAKIAFILIFGGALHGVALPILQIPTLLPQIQSSFTRQTIPASRFLCESLFSGGPAKTSPSNVEAETRRVIQAANREFERRGWSPQFLEERYTLARRYETQSEYIYLTDNKNGIVATMGLTLAEYTKATLPDPARPAVESRSHSEILPEEETLHLRPLARPLTAEGRGMIVELRTWSIAKDLLGGTERSAAFAELLAGTLPLLFSKLLKYPGLYDKPILHLYADETSLKLYGLMGFKATHADPIEHSGSKWWDMALTPRKFEAFVNRVHEPEFLSSLNQVLEINLGEGRSASLAPGSFMMHDTAPQFPGKTIGKLAKPSEVAPGVLAARGAMVSWHKNGKLAYVSKLARALKLTEDIEVSAGGEVLWNSEGALVRVTQLAHDTSLAPGLWVAKGGSMEWYGDGKTPWKVHHLARPLTLENGLIAAPGAHVEWRLPGAQVSFVSRLHKTGRLEDGTLAAAGAEVRWANDLRTGKIRWKSLSELAEPHEVHPGMTAPAGAGVYFLRLDQAPLIQKR